MADGGNQGERWFCAAELAGLPGLPGTERNVRATADRMQWAKRRRAGRGGGCEYPLTALPSATQAALLLASASAGLQHEIRPEKHEWSDARRQAAWAQYERASDKHRSTATQQLNALAAVDALVASGRALMDARAVVAAQLQRDGVRGGSVPSLRRWAKAIEDVPSDCHLAALLPSYAGSTKLAGCDVQAWDWYCGHYLERSRPTHAETYRRLQEMARAQGWVIPCADSLERRMNAEVSRVAQVLRRDGVAAANKLLPVMQRDAMSFAVGEAINGDGIKFDRVWVRFEDGEILNTATAWVWQDIHSRRLLAWRLDKTENTDVFRLATYDVTGVCAPEHVWMDNTRVAANKLMTAGASGRHRFKADPEDGVGLLLMLGMEPHFTNPDKETGNPGAKPIERAFGMGGLHEMVATNPKIVAKGGFSKATAIDVGLLREVIAQEVTRFNARELRRTQACRGVLSFDQAWEAGLQQRPPRILSESQRRLLLMCREVVRADTYNGELRIEAGRGPYGQNAYWCEHLPQHAGRKLVAHYDPEHLDAGVHVYSLDGRYLFQADHIERGAFKDAGAAREHGKLRRRVSKANKAIAGNVTRMNALERAALYTSATAGNPPPVAPAADSNVVSGHFRQVPDPQRDAVRRTGTDDATPTAFDDYLQRLQQQQFKERGWEPPTD